MPKQRLILAIFLLSVAINAIGMVASFSLLALPALLAGWYAADFASGMIHLYMDYRPCPEGRRLDELFFYKGSRESPEYADLFRQRMAAVSPLERLVYDFKNHHPRPWALGRRPVWRLIGSTVIVAALPISLGVNVVMMAVPVPSWVSAFFVSFIIGGGFAQYFHGTLHRLENPWFVTLMRKVGLLMTPEAHQLHHDTLQRDFATNCGWSNPLINPLFRTLRSRGYLNDAGLIPSS